MLSPLTSHRVGRATVTKILELPLEGIDPSFLYPGADPSVATDAVKRLGPDAVDARTGLLRMSVHAWLVRTPDRLVLVDTAAGNGKDRPGSPVFDHLGEPFLERLRAAGARPGDITAVLHTHLHVDHVGWNTRQDRGAWLPTFQNARYLFSGRERAYVAALLAENGSDEAILREAGLGERAQVPDTGFFPDSILPVIQAGQASEITVNGSEALEGFSFIPSAGHSIDHASVAFVSEGEHALFWGDLMHNPFNFCIPTGTRPIASSQPRRGRPGSG